jgi:taurine dioxygenase
MQTTTRLEVQPVAGALGAEIAGVDLGADLDDATIAEIRRALLDHCVIFFRDQEFDAEQHKRLARRFGEIFVHPNYVGMQADPEVVMIRREPGDTRVVGEEWHTDTTMMPRPPMGAILYALEVPPHGGDTLFASQYLAYESLSEGMKRLLAGLRAVHSDRLVAGPHSNRSVGRTTKARADADWRETISVHPIVATHPETGRKLLFVNHSYTVGIEGLTDDEARPLLAFLMDHGHRPEFTCRFRWTRGAVAFWDNRCVKHLAVNDAGPFRRVMRRIQIA